MPSVRESLLHDPARPDARDYRRTWMTAEGHAYRLKAHERQSKYGTKPLDANPTFDEVRTALRAHEPQSVLEVGCGWGRILQEWSAEFNVEGCDVSADMLK